MPNANSYEVWRRPAETPGAQSNLVYEATGQTNNAFDDFAVSSSPTNTYFLKAKLTVNRVVITTTGGEMNYAFQPVVYYSPPSTPVNGSVTPVPPYQQWRQSQFTLLQITNSSISGNLADPDHDGLPNIWKYAMGLNPWMAPGPGLVRADLLHTNSAVYATMTYRLAKPAPADLTLFVDCTTNLASLNWTTNGVTTLGTVDWGTTWKPWFERPGLFRSASRVSCACASISQVLSQADPAQSMCATRIQSRKTCLANLETASIIA